MVSGACFTGLVLYILFALSYYALIKAILSLELYSTKPGSSYCALIKAVLSLQRPAIALFAYGP